ncbi:hypothetical protein ID007_004297 [Salmonella enterica]|nr:hypothetical protein [Salmonella enterica]
MIKYSSSSINGRKFEAALAAVKTPGFSLPDHAPYLCGLARAACVSYYDDARKACLPEEGIPIYKKINKEIVGRYKDGEVLTIVVKRSYYMNDDPYKLHEAWRRTFDEHCADTAQGYAAMEMAITQFEKNYDQEALNLLLSSFEALTGAIEAELDYIVQLNLREPELLEEMKEDGFDIHKVQWMTLAPAA